MRSSSTWNRFVYVFTSILAVIFIALILRGQPPGDPELKVMKIGLGIGTITGTGINCGTDCDQNFNSSDSVTLTAAQDGSSTFAGWGGDCAFAGTGTCTLAMSVARAVTANFTLNSTITTITDFTPGGLNTYLTAHPEVDRPSRFIAALPRDFRQNWILVSRSESLQTGTAQSPRILLPSADARSVFTIGMTTQSSYPGAHPLAIEYMQWDAAEKNFRFHEVILGSIGAMGTLPARTRHVSIDDDKCSKCHSTRNVLNRTTMPGTTGITPGTVQLKNKPNWDAYDSWGGMTPFNRDRIYQGSIEAAAFKSLFNLWNWRNSVENDEIRQTLEQLELQAPYVATDGPHAINRNINMVADNDHIRFGFDSRPAIPTTTASVGYSFDRAAEAPTPVTQGGRYVTLRHSDPKPSPETFNDDYTNPGSDEGRGVQLFDLLGGLDGNLNAQRVADELINHRFATSDFSIDVRPTALAIIKLAGDGRPCIRVDGGTVSSTPAISASILNFLQLRNGNLSISTVVNDTARRVESLPKRKADIQKMDLDRSIDPYLLGNPTPTPAVEGLIQRYGAGTTSGTDTSLNRLRAEVFRRPIDLGRADRTAMGRIYVDRERYGTVDDPTSVNYTDLNIDKVALYRYFLEPLGVSVDKWSMGVRGRSRTYTFADVFEAYENIVIDELETSLRNDPRGLTLPDLECGSLINAVNDSLDPLPAANQVPKYTDVQRIFNKSCIECHGGLDYPPYVNFSSTLNLAENENPPSGVSPLRRPHGIAETRAMSLAGSLFRRITANGNVVPPYNPATLDERCPNFGLMPCGGPPLSQVDIETIRRWITGGHNYSEGDPHIRTIDGVSYDFQSAGEFVLLRDDTVEIQTRQTPVETESPLGPNGHTGLSSCVSINTAVAIRVGAQRITYQPNISGEPDPSGMQLRIDGKLTNMDGPEIRLERGGRIVRTTAPGGIQIESPGGTIIVVTPNWWAHRQLWYVNIDTRQARAPDGVMGAVPPGSWLPALPDGSSLGPLPRDLHQRYVDLYERFESAWRVTDTTTLFDYGTGTSTATFTIESWPEENVQRCVVPRQNPEAPPPPSPQKTLSLEVAQQNCAAIVDAVRKNNCVQDVMATGEVTFARTYLMTERIERNSLPNTPTLGSPDDNKADVGKPTDFTWNTTTDADNDNLTYRYCVWREDADFTLNDCDSVPVQATMTWHGSRGYALIVLLIGILLLALLIFFMGLRRRRVLLGALVIVIIAAVGLAFYFGRTNFASPTISRSVARTNKGMDLEPGKGYFWKVIVDDGNGGSTESETRRFEVK